MLEKQKKWCKEKTEKGIRWLNKNKFAVGVTTGCVGWCVTALIHDKIFENKKAGISFAYIKNDDGTWADKFGLETYGIDRFGKLKPGHMAVFKLSDARGIIEDIQGTVNDINEHNKNQS